MIVPLPAFGVLSGDSCTRNRSLREAIHDGSGLHYYAASIFLATASRIGLVVFTTNYVVCLIFTVQFAWSPEKTEREQIATASS
jgi:hypothetical protein